jgi:phenylpropionate dioxygenase-like ring-hydroxylating dioxygenase large terminal subunit
MTPPTKTDPSIPTRTEPNGARPTADHVDVRGLVDADNGLVSRQVYADEQIYRAELERVFARAWLYVGHASQVREPGDYITTFMGEDPVILVRGSDGVVRAFLNSCRHRGMRICRADEGNTSFFRCPYHAWTYADTGNLRGVPKFREAYEGTLDKDDWGLKQVAQLEEYQGLIFATWAADAPDLQAYLGNFTFFLDLTFGRDPAGTELVGGTHKWVIDCNWKHPAENFACDMYHAPSAHQRPAELGMMEAFADEGYEISAGMGYVGHQLARHPSTDFETDDTLHGYWALPNSYTYELKDQRRRIAALHGDDVARLIPLGHSSTFPNFSFLDLENLRLIRTQQPLGAGRTMVHQWCCVDAGLPDDVKDDLRRQYELAFGPAGLLEQDDGENWRECQVGMTGHIGRNLDTNMWLGMKDDGKPASELLGEGIPGRGGGIWSEFNQRQFYRHWDTFMTAADWAQISAEIDTP